MRSSILVLTLLLAGFLLAQRGDATVLLAVDAPAYGTVIPQTFTIEGSALSADVIHVWGWPASGPVFFGTAIPNLADPIRQRSDGGFRLLVRDAPVGTYPIAVYAHDPATGTFPTQVVSTFTVRACNYGTWDWAFAGPGVSVAFPMWWMCL